MQLEPAVEPNLFNRTLRGECRRPVTSASLLATAVGVLPTAALKLAATAVLLLPTGAPKLAATATQWWRANHPTRKMLLHEALPFRLWSMCSSRAITSHLLVNPLTLILTSTSTLTLTLTVTLTLTLTVTLTCRTLERRNWQEIHPHDRSVTSSRGIHPLEFAVTLPQTRSPVAASAMTS
jgi:hypothetical protein